MGTQALNDISNLHTTVNSRDLHIEEKTRAHTSEKTNLQKQHDLLKKEAEEWEEVARNTKMKWQADLHAMAGERQTFETQLHAKQKELEETEQIAMTTKKQWDAAAKQAAAKSSDLERQVNELESRFNAKQMELVAKLKDAEEWEQVASNTKKKGDEAARTSAARITGLDDEIATLQTRLAGKQRDLEATHKKAQEWEDAACTAKENPEEAT